MTTETDGWTDRLSEYLDGGLDADERASLEAHLAECERCRKALVGLREVVAQARRLPEAAPSEDLWPGIAAAIGAPLRARRGAVIPLPTAEPRASFARASRGVTLTAPQLAAAAVLLVVTSVSATWWAGPGVAAREAQDAAPTGVMRLAVDGPPPPAGLAEELGALEDALATSSADLDPNTVRVIEKNLAVIQRAIDESRQALAVEPGNAFLVEHLERAYRRKLSYLREATRLVAWSG